MLESQLSAVTNHSVSDSSSGKIAGDSMQGALLPILQGLMKGFGWHDERDQIYAQDQKSVTEESAVKKAINAYETDPTPENHLLVVDIFQKKIDSLESEYKHARKQFNYYVEKNKHFNSSKSKSSFKEKLSHFFGSDDEQQAKKYEAISTEIRHKIDNLRMALEKFQELPHDTTYAWSDDLNSDAVESPEFMSRDVQQEPSVSDGLVLEKSEVMRSDQGHEKLFSLSHNPGQRHLLAAPVITTNTISITQGQTATVSSCNSFRITATGSVSQNQLTFNVVNAQHGQFCYTTSCGLTQFTGAQYYNQLSFRHDGSTFPPGYILTASDGTSTSAPSTVSVAFDLLPILTNNRLSIKNGGTVTIDPSMISATDDTTPAGSLIFNVVNINRGYFRRQSSSTPMTTFYQSDVQSGSIFFIHDGSNVSPIYQITVNAGGCSVTSPQSATISFDYTPVVTGTLPIRTYGQYQKFRFTIPSSTFSDAGGDTLTWSADTSDQSGLPSGLQFSPGSRTFTGPVNGIGTWNISLKATDPAGLYAMTFFPLEILEFPPTTEDNHCSIAGMSKYKSDGVACKTVNGIIISLPSAASSFLLFASLYFIKEKLINHSWSDKRYRIHNKIRKELKFEIGLLDQETNYENAIFDMIGLLLDIPMLEKEKEFQHRGRIAKRVKELSEEEATVYAAALVFAIKSHVRFPEHFLKELGCCKCSKCCTKGDAEKKDDHPVMPVYRNFYDTIPHPLPCLLTYKFNPNILFDLSDKIIETAKNVIARQEDEFLLVSPDSLSQKSCCSSSKPREKIFVLKENKDKSDESHAVGFFCCKKPREKIFVPKESKDKSDEKRTERESTISLEMSSSSF